MKTLQVHQNYEEIITGYLLYTKEVRGITHKASLRNLIYYAKRFCIWLEENKVIDVERIHPDHVINFIKVCSKNYKRSTLGSLSPAIRSFLLYFRVQGIGHQKLADSVPTMKSPRLKRVPTYLNIEQEKTLLDSFNRETDQGIRNYAIALLLVKLGLRASEVANLQLDDIDWKNGILKVRNEKSKKIDRLPLLKEVGDALEDYVIKSRPKATIKNVFLRLRGTTAKSITLGAVSITMSKAIRDQDITVAGAGSHIMRRTVASRMVQNGAKIKDIADVLRHSNLQTVNIYTKINIPLLKEVAMPWPITSKGGAL